MFLRVKDGENCGKFAENAAGSAKACPKSVRKPDFERLEAAFRRNRCGRQDGEKSSNFDGGIKKGGSEAAFKMKDCWFGGAKGSPEPWP
jgi:hypothetical protein